MRLTKTEFVNYDALENEEWYLCGVIVILRRGSTDTLRVFWREIGMFWRGRYQWWILIGC